MYLGGFIPLSVLQTNIIDCITIFVVSSVTQMKESYFEF